MLVQDSTSFPPFLNSTFLYDCRGETCTPRKSQTIWKTMKKKVKSPTIPKSVIGVDNCRVFSRLSCPLEHICIFNYNYAVNSVLSFFTLYVSFVLLSHKFSPSTQKYILCVRLCSRHLGCITHHNKDSGPQGVYGLVAESERQIVNGESKLYSMLEDGKCYGNKKSEIKRISVGEGLCFISIVRKGHLLCFPPAPTRSCWLIATWV